MEPSSAGQRLAALGNAIATGVGSPQYTPPGTPLAGAPTPIPRPTYTPPVLGNPTAGASSPATPVQLTMPQRDAPKITPLGAPLTTAPIPTRPVVQPLTPQQPITPPPTPTPTPTNTPIATTYNTPNQEQVPLPTPPVPETHAAPLYTRPITPDTSYVAQPQQPTPLAPSYVAPRAPSRIRALVLWSTIFATTTMLVMGLLYWYGSQSSPLSDGDSLRGERPENGFQVTESSIYEPNFDQEIPTSSVPGVNTDPSRMFDDSALPQ